MAPDDHSDPGPVPAPVPDGSETEEAGRSGVFEHDVRVVSVTTKMRANCHARPIMRRPYVSSRQLQPRQSLSTDIDPCSRARHIPPLAPRTRLAGPGRLVGWPQAS